MVKAPSLGLLVATICCIARCASAPTTTHQHLHQPHPDSLVDHGDDYARSERSAGMARKIQFFVKNFHLQILPDGTVNGTMDDGSIYTILQRTAIGIGKLKIQGVGTCQYLCMDACGFLYGSREFNEECVFNELIQEHHYNTYSSTRYSNEKRTMYLALNRRGTPRKVLLHAGHPLGRLSSYTRVLTRTVPPQKLEDLHPMRHHGHTCQADSAPKPTSHQQPQGRCRRLKKGWRRKRKKQQQQQQHNGSSSRYSDSINSKCEPDSSSAECQRFAADPKRSSSAPTKLGDRLAPLNGATKKKRKTQLKGINKSGPGGKKRLKTTTPSPTTSTLYSTNDEVTEEGDYLDGTTALEWDDPTVAPTPDEAVAAATLPD